MCEENCLNCYHEDSCGLSDCDTSKLSEIEAFEEHCVGCCCGDGTVCNKGNTRYDRCDNWEHKDTPIEELLG